MAYWGKIETRGGVEGSTVRKIKTIVFWWTVSGELRKTFNADDERVTLQRTAEPAEQWKRYRRRQELSRFIVGYLYARSAAPEETGTETAAVPFSVKEIMTAFNRHERQGMLELAGWDTNADEVQETLLEKWGRFFPFIFPAEHEKMQGKNRPHFSLDLA